MKPNINGFPQENPNTPYFHMEGKMTTDEMTVKTTSRMVTIQIPVKLLIKSQELREDSITVTDKDGMLDYIREYLLDWGGDSERGSTAFEDFLDGFFMDALESGEDWVSGWWEDEA